jgi:hypothetical protein
MSKFSVGDKASVHIPGRYEHPEATVVEIDGGGLLDRTFVRVEVPEEGYAAARPKVDRTFWVEEACLKLVGGPSGSPVP